MEREGGSENEREGKRDRGEEGDGERVRKEKKKNWFANEWHR